MRRLLSLTLALALVACGDDSTSEPTTASVAGTWSLQSVNGAALPFILSPSPSKIELLSNVVTVSANGTWTSTTQTRTTIGTQAPTTASSTQSGTYTLSGSAVSIRSTDGSTVQAGTVSGNTLTLAQTGLVFIYTKQ